MEYYIGAPFEIAIDIAGHFHRSSSGNVLIVMHDFSRWSETYSIPKQESVTVVYVLFENWICRYEVPWEIYSTHMECWRDSIAQLETS